MTSGGVAYDCHIPLSVYETLPTAGKPVTLFTHLSVPVMTRLRQPERQVLDTLVDSGVARSRAEALAWCVKLVGEHADSWLGDLRQAMEAVQKVRDQGPEL